MCEDLENKAQGYSIYRTREMYGIKRIYEVREMIAEAYKKGYKDARSEERDSVAETLGNMVLEMNKILLQTINDNERN